MDRLSLRKYKIGKKSGYKSVIAIFLLYKADFCRNYGCRKLQKSARCN